MSVFMNTYHRLPVVFTHGEGSVLYDTDGRKYIDLASGIAVNALGYNYPPLVEAIAAQAAKLCHTCNYYMSDTVDAFAEKLVAACAPSGMKKVFLCNSGAEANEGAVKVARKYSFDRYGPGRHTIVTLRNSFHGRTLTTLAATGQDAFHGKFLPLTEGFAYVEAGDIAALDRALDGKSVAAFMLEPIQGESGVRPLPGGYLKAAAEMCAARDILLIADEVQAGTGRTGTFLACEGYGITPDVVTLAKGLCGGIPGGAFLAGEKAADTLGVGDHGSTFGGNPVAAAAGIVVIDTVTEPRFLAEIVRKGDKMASIIKGWGGRGVAEVRGRGLMLAADIAREAWPVLEKGVAKAKEGGFGLLALTAGSHTLRFLPPYVITDQELETGLEILQECLD
jgi:acetylornithine/N-succinyldiaminopimelate aminotransferase